MKIEKGDTKRQFLSTTVGGTEITDAVNAVQRAYDAFIGDAWDAPDVDGEERGARVAARTVAWSVALAAHHMILTRGAPESIAEAVADMVGETVASMERQIERSREAARREVKA